MLKASDQSKTLKSSLKFDIGLITQDQINQRKSICDMRSSKSLIYIGLFLTIACQSKQDHTITSATQETQKIHTVQSIQDNPHSSQGLLKTEPYQPEKDDSPVLARIADVVITEKEFERRLNLLTPFILSLLSPHIVFTNLALV